MGYQYTPILSNMTILNRWWGEFFVIELCYVLASIVALFLSSRFWRREKYSDAVSLAVPSDVGLCENLQFYLSKKHEKIRTIVYFGK